VLNLFRFYYLLIRYFLTGGEQVRSDVTKQLQTPSHLPIGNVVQTPGHGELLCKRIIHVSSPTWQGGRQGEENQLYDAIYNVMMEAVRLRVHTVALPAIGAGTHCFPADICATTMVAAVSACLNVMSDTTGLRELRFVDRNSQIVDQWIKCLQDNGLTARSECLRLNV
jgi:O-acetyl-ADP-ribose deacetylase (regulator of RNase III)